MKPIVLAVSLAVAAAAVPAAAQAVSQRYELNIPRQPLDAALKDLANQTGLQIARFVQIGDAGLMSGPVNGTLSAEEALQSLLAPQELTYKVVNDRTIAVVESASSGSREKSDSSAPKSFWQRLRLAQVSGGQGNVSSSRQGDGAQSADEENTGDRGKAQFSQKETELEEIIVTGTNIKGVKDQFSPVAVASREEMDAEGFTNVSDLFEKLPQNFGGGVSPDRSRAGSDSGAGSAGVNLRGLGNESTLVLLNGKRLAPGGASGNFVDVSTIPTSAIDRVEVVSDGASAIYGADAIGGVANIILRKDFDGLESRLTLGTTTDGGRDTIILGQTAGVSAEDAFGMVTYQYSYEDGLSATQRDFSDDALGPGPSYLLPQNKKNSVLLSGGYSPTGSVSISSDAYFNDRDTESYLSADYDSLKVVNSQHVKTKQWGFDPTIELSLSPSWDLTAGSSYSRFDFSSDFSNFFIPIYPAPRVLKDRSKFDVWTVNASVGGPLFKISTTPVSATFGAQFRRERINEHSRLDGVPTIDRERSRRARSMFAEIYAPIIEPSNSVPGVNRLAATAAVRYDDYSDIGTTVNPRFGALWSPARGITFRGTYGTSFRPARLDQLIPKIGGAVIVAYRDPATSERQTGLLVSGNSDALDPEKARTWTAGFDLEPGFIPNLLIRTTYFDIDYRDRLGNPLPVFNDIHEVISYPGRIIDDPDGSLAQAFAAQASALIDNSISFPELGGPLLLSDVSVILDNRLQNIARTKVDGLELSIVKRFSISYGSLNLTADATKFFNYEQRPSADSSWLAILNTYGNPVDVKLRAGAQLALSSSSVNIFVNRVGDYTDNRAGGPEAQIESWTTLDASMVVQLDDLIKSDAFRGANLIVSIINLTDEPPPFLGPRRAALEPFDTANANPEGRRIQIVLAKRW